jgi:hypothetical protein
MVREQQQLAAAAVDAPTAVLVGLEAGGVIRLFHPAPASLARPCPTPAPQTMFC